MGLARDELDLVKEGKSILNRCKPDEPVFILRAKDLLAPAMVELWIAAGIAFGVEQEKVEAAKFLAKQMRIWRETNNPKLPD